MALIPNIDTDQYFWYTTHQQDIDLIEDDGEFLSAFEFKWNSKSKAKFPQTFTEAYKIKTTSVISLNNIEDFLLL